MSDDMTSAGLGRPRTTSGDESSTVDTAKHEAAAVKDTAMDAEKAMLNTAKDEAAGLAHETKAQAMDLFAQTRQELTDQAATQQERIAAGLQTIGDELSSMAHNADDSGVASDLVRRASARVSSAGTWLGDRDPSGVLADVKAFARRRPGAFIAGALLAGIAAGRLARALAANAHDAEAATPPASVPTPPEAPVAVTATPVDAYDVGAPTEDSPLYAEAVGRHEGAEGTSRDRSDTV